MKIFSSKIRIPRVTKESANESKVVPFPEFEHKLQFDGCSKSNPGFAGAGAVIYKLDKEISTIVQFVGNKETNNVAEYTGLIVGLKEAINLNIKRIEVEGDSMLVIKQMKGEWAVKSNNLLHLYNEAKTLSSQFDTIVFKHIYRENNKRADELSNLAVSSSYFDKNKYYDKDDEDEPDEIIFSNLQSH